MNIIGMIIFTLVGTGIIVLSIRFYSREKMDYSQYRWTTATVLHGRDSKWVVEFKDENGRERLALDDRMMGYTFHPERDAIPKCGNTEEVYYWEHHSNRWLDGEKVMYRFHFCNEKYYELIDMKERKNLMRGKILGIFIIFSGIIILFFGYK